jgi:hypothetical protein
MCVYVANIVVFGKSTGIVVCVYGACIVVVFGKSTGIVVVCV